MRASGVALNVTPAALVLSQWSGTFGTVCLFTPVAGVSCEGLAGAGAAGVLNVTVLCSEPPISSADALGLACLCAVS